MTDEEIVNRAAEVFARLDRIKEEQRILDAEMSALCRAYDTAMRVWGWQPHMMRRAIEARSQKRA